MLIIIKHHAILYAYSPVVHETREFCPFLRTEKTGKMNARMMKTISVSEGFDTNMVECELCLQWYHYKCVGITDMQVVV